ncbi:hypothetical protein, partial [Staphylococcus aureus]
GARNGNHQRIQAYRDLSVAQSKIAAHFGSALLEAPAPQRGLVLIEGTPDWGTVCEVIQRARATVGVEITAIAENAAVRDIAAAQATTHE